MERYRALGVPVTVASWMPLWRAQPTFRETLSQFVKALCSTWKARGKMRAVAKRIRDEFDVVHVNYESLLPIALWLKFVVSKPQVLHNRARLRRTPWGRLHVKLASWIAQELVFITENERDHFIRLGGRDGSVIYNPTPDITAVDDSEIELSSDRRLKVASLSNYSHDRGVDRVVQIAKALNKRKCEDILFVMLGDMALHLSDPGRLGEIARQGGKLSDYADEEGVLDMFLFAGHVTNPDTWLRRCDVVVKLSRFDEPWGRDVIEAMAYGKPVLATGVWTGFVQDGYNGMLFEKFRADDFAKALEHLMSDETMVRHMGDRAREHITRVCNPEQQARKLLAVWEAAAQSV